MEFRGVLWAPPVSHQWPSPLMLYIDHDKNILELSIPAMSMHNIGHQATLCSVEASAEKNSLMQWQKTVGRFSCLADTSLYSAILMLILRKYRINICQGKEGKNGTCLYNVVDFPILVHVDKCIFKSVSVCSIEICQVC